MKRRILRILIWLAGVGVILFILTLPGPRLSYVSTQPMYANGPIGLKYELQNRSSWPIYYSGYGPGSPFYRVAYRSEAGWEEQLLGVCGTGVRTSCLAPWKSVSIYVTPDCVDTSRTFRVGLSYWRANWLLPFATACQTTWFVPYATVWSE